MEAGLAQRAANRLLAALAEAASNMGNEEALRVDSLPELLNQVPVWAMENMGTQMKWVGAIFTFAGRDPEQIVLTLIDYQEVKWSMFGSRRVPLISIAVQVQVRVRESTPEWLPSPRTEQWVKELKEASKSQPEHTYFILVAAQ